MSCGHKTPESVESLSSWNNSFPFFPFAYHAHHKCAAYPVHENEVNISITLPALNWKNLNVETDTVERECESCKAEAQRRSVLRSSDHVPSLGTSFHAWPDAGVIDEHAVVCCYSVLCSMNARVWKSMEKIKGRVIKYSLTGNTHRDFTTSQTSVQLEKEGFTGSEEDVGRCVADVLHRDVFHLSQATSLPQVCHKLWCR